MPRIKRTFHIDHATLVRLIEASHGFRSGLSPAAFELAAVESLAHHLTAAARYPAQVTVVNVERFNLEVTE
ncbi:MAG TPA: hypothetical protein VJK49_08220 [Candidatus Limnocylindrales bacterium]|nr:hypothetical protein [Candidatus Limnocylindrales bacterium]